MVETEGVDLWSVPRHPEFAANCMEPKASAEHVEGQALLFGVGDIVMAQAFKNI